MKHNNQLPNTHLRKHWQERTKTWFNQPMRKLRRHNNRVKKAVATAPIAAQGVLRPNVSCSSRRYNFKIRLGRGFTLQELKAAGIRVPVAKSIGIAIDYRRTNKSQENLDRNKEKLKEYLSHLTIVPLNKEKREKRGLSLEGHVQFMGKILPPVNKPVREAPRLITAAEKKFDAHATLKKATSDAKWWGARDKKRRDKEEASKN